MRKTIKSKVIRVIRNYINNQVVYIFNLKAEKSKLSIKSILHNQFL